MAPDVPSSAQTTTRLDWNGTLATGVWACEFTATQSCQALPGSAFGQSHQFAGLFGNATAGGLSLAWSPATPLTQELVFEGAILTPGCAECNKTVLEGQRGPSPLVIPLGGVRFAEGEVLAVAVYSNQYASTGQGAAGTSGDQGFQVSGTIVLQA